VPDIYVICPHSVIRSGELAVGKGNALHHALTDEVEAGRLVFPSTVVNDCRNFDDGSPSTLWVKAVSGSVAVKAVPYDHTEWVMDECPEAEDELVDDWQPNIDILAVAHYLVEIGRDPCVVTDDVAPSPTRLCLADACAKLNFQTMTFAAYRSALGLP
jgi:hypothetical protein